MKDSFLIQRTKNHEALLDYLLMADESEDVVRSYYDQGELYELIYDHATIGACLMTFPEGGIAEIKNIALSEDVRGQGLGKRTIAWLVDHYKGRGYKQLIVGTSNSSLENLAFYQKPDSASHL
ncbi:GNAT family N-acetyltransferase [Halobacillus locisalis]|uniref:GNAT family N-acetyltransferase n=1 Tax=Halobacillus locisalis TaxID=220753 RepID=UPI001FE4E256|nr:GNAT family N-acetyltransferase [Halobacillus locisalis]